MGADDIEETLAEIRAFTRDLRASTARQIAAEEPRDAQDPVAAARRAGEHGPAWQKVQQRIDLRQTTVADVLGGLDTSAEAREVRAGLRDVLGRARAQYALQLNDPEVAEEVAAARAARADLAATIVDVQSARD